MSEKVCVVDFDGSVNKFSYPGLGEAVPGAIDGIKFLQSKGYKITLFTMRSDDLLEQAVNWLKSQGVELQGINHTPGQRSWTNSPKAYGHFYIDDAAIGCPLIYPIIGRHYVDWPKVIDIIFERERKEGQN